jgi:hypothetical protein
MPHALHDLKQLDFSLNSSGASSYNTGRAGIHIHTSSNKMGPTSLIKIISHFICQNADKLKKLSRRRDFTYCKFHKTVEEYRLHRYSAVNYNSTLKTTEFRLWRGTLVASSFLAYAELTHAMVRFAETFPNYDLPMWDKFRTVVYDNKDIYPNAIIFLEKYL